MARFEASIHIERPVDEVFQFLTRAENFSIWQAGLVDNVADRDGDPEVGATGRSSIRVLGRTFEIRWTIDEIEPDHHVAISVEWEAGRGTARWTCEPDGVGTRFTISNESDDPPPASAFGTLARLFVERVQQGNLETSAANLKRILEA